jgi:hypothetical protein
VQGLQLAIVSTEDEQAAAAQQAAKEKNYRQVSCVV